MKFLPLALAAVVATSVEAFSPLSHPRTTSIYNVGSFSMAGKQLQQRNDLLFSSKILLDDPETMEATTTTSNSKENKSANKGDNKKEDFVNNSPMAWMQDFFDLAGTVPGQTIAYGPFAKGQVPESQRTSVQEAAKRQDEAARNLQNIDMDERTRRLNASNAMAVAGAIYAVWAALIGDQGDFGGHMLRFLTIFPLFLSVGYRLSAQTGL
jgi:hypothetical protein